ncbi:hypothetical protein PHMEG_00016245 [Phytophthora megakarya]|uniref:Uncharacterized protein n=1 Tax=Phytophthora megakarya TaxID=4795 RepID=A0A225VZR8_9STRA|nr:hypothetical protein PHMEG_00016245 [Phytophthora megakarya]
MGSRRVFPLSVDTAGSATNVNRSQPPPPKSPVHRSPGNGSTYELARPPTGGSVGYMGLDRLMMMRQVNAAAPTTIQFGTGGEEVSAAVNHRQRMAAEQQRRLETALMEKEDYTGTPEGHERLQRQEERSRMREEELLVLRFVEMEKEAARKLQREKELEEEKRVKEQYLAKIRAQREQQEREAKEKEAARKVEMERKMKALKEAADAKARAEFAEKQHALEEEARLAREKHQIEVEIVQMQVEDVLGHGMQQEMIIERERQQQIAAEQDEWRLFQEREQEKQREAAQLRRAAMAEQYEQDKQRRVQIHKLQKERAAQQAERREMQKKSDRIQLKLNIASAQKQGLTPFAQVLNVADNSPAMQATLKSGDLLVDFDGIVSSTPKCLMEMADCVQKKVNQAIPVVLLRPVGAMSEESFEEVRVSLCPQKWKGKGLIGCQLSPYKWPTEEENAQTTNENETYVTKVEEAANVDDGATALVVYDIVPASVADHAGLLNGDILAGCNNLECSVNVANLSLVVDHIQTKRASRMPVYLDINRWIDEDQCYRSLRVELASGEDPGPLGFALTSFGEYYNYYSSTTASVSACQDCYYTSLTTALHAAALSGHVSCLEVLLNSLLNGDGGGYSAIDYLDWRDEDGRTPLFYACYAGQVECVRYLLNIMQSVSTEKHPFVKAGVDLYGDTVLHAASTSGNVKVVALLLESGCVKVDDRNHTRLACAHVAPNVEILKFLGEQTDVDLLATDAEERMPLAYACLRNDIESIQYLCKKHPDFVDYADIRGNTPLHVAAWLGLQQAAEVLISFLPSIALFITNEDGQNAAELARSSGMESVAAYLESAIATADSKVS